MKDALSQSESLESRGKWVAKIQEYDLEIHPKKIIKGQGSVEMLNENKSKAIQASE